MYSEDSLTIKRKGKPVPYEYLIHRWCTFQLLACKFSWDRDQCVSTITVFVLFCCHCTTNDWKCLFSYFVKGINKRRRNFISLIRLYLQRKLGVISTKKVKSTRVLFYLKGDVLLLSWGIDAWREKITSGHRIRRFRNRCLKSLYQGPDVLTKESFPRMFYSIYVHMLLFAQLL